MKQGILFIFLITFFGLPTVNAQNDWLNEDNKPRDTESGPTLVQFSGIIVTADSLKPVPFVNIIDKTTRRGTSSDYF